MTMKIERNELRIAYRIRCLFFGPQKMGKKYQIHINRRRHYGISIIDVLMDDRSHRVSMILKNQIQAGIDLSKASCHNPGLSPIQS
jgi:hypothetical protein